MIRNTIILLLLHLGRKELNNWHLFKLTKFLEDVMLLCILLLLSVQDNLNKFLHTHIHTHKYTCIIFYLFYEFGLNIMHKNVIVQTKIMLLNSSVILYVLPIAVLLDQNR